MTLNSYFFEPFRLAEAALLPDDIEARSEARRSRDICPPHAFYSRPYTNNRNKYQHGSPVMVPSLSKRGKVFNKGPAGGHDGMDSLYKKREPTS